MTNNSGSPRDLVNKSKVAISDLCSVPDTKPAAPHSVAYAGPSEFPAGAIVNGRTHIDRLESFYRFDCEAGPLINCDDWHGLKRCFEHLAERTSHGQAPAAGAVAGPAEPTQEMIAAVLRLVDLGQSDPEDHRYDDGSKLATQICRAVIAVALTPAAQADSLDHLHNLLYAAQTSTGGAQMQAITDARIYLSKLRHAHHKQGEPNGKAS